MRPIDAIRDPDLLASAQALARAARRARELAIHTHTRLVVIEQGRLIRLEPGVATAGDQVREPGISKPKAAPEAI